MNQSIQAKEIADDVSPTWRCAMRKHVEHSSDKLLFKYGALEYFLKRNDVVPCVNCRKLNCLGKVDLDSFPGRSCLRHFQCCVCRVYGALLMSKVLEILIVAALDPAIMDQKDPYRKTRRIKEVLGKFLPAGEWVGSPVTLLPDRDTVTKEFLWLPS